jgi:hypothetical protein
MKLPTRLADLLTSNAELLGAVNLTLHDFLIWFGDRNMVFFPEYTDHGPKHIEEVIVTAEALIKDESWTHLTPEDAAVLVLSIVLHDCAMHLSEDGFVEIVSPASSRQIVPGFSERPWPELWADFLAEASRFDARKLKALLGDAEPIRRPPLEGQEMTRRDRLLIGEFLRRHHPRLAHEIALWGVPGPSEEKIRLVRVPHGLANLSGLIARSHGLNLRESVNTLPRNHRREYLKVHAPFLMTILRVADYIQIHSERAPTQVLKVRSLKSPVSQGEWRAHDAIEDINSTHDDPEALVITARPRDVKDFLKLERLLSGLQRELDDSWAFLGEVYGLLPGLRDLGLTIRRVRSNLDDRQEFAKTVLYYPDLILFEADPEILKLLIEPLYGDNGGIAIRELVQNAVDACLELRDYLRSTAPQRPRDVNSYKSEVTVHLDGGKDGGWLTVRDNGIGMTSDVVKNYFLKAGASFRRSDAWKRQHETVNGKPRVLRSGRFGIGVLAAFLLGDQVEVTTRHFSNPPDHGIQFSASIDDEAIELQRVNLPEVGTTVRVRLPKGTVAKFKQKYSSPWEDKWDWDWYFLEEPAVIRTITAESQSNDVITTEVLKHEHFIPGSHTELPADWHRIGHEDFDDIHWHFSEKPDHRREDMFFCNGIRIAGEYSTGPNIEKKLNWQLSIKEPILSIFDAAGKLPLNLARSNLTRELAFERELLEDIYRDLISYLLVRTPTKPLCNPKTAQIYGRISYPGNNRRDWFWSTPEGLSLTNKWFIRRLSPPNLYLVPELTALPFHIPKRHAYIASFDRTRSGFGYYDPWVRFALTGFGFHRHWLAGVKAKGRRLLVSTDYEDRIRKRKFIPKTFLATMTEEWRDGNWVLLSSKNCPPPTVSFQQLAGQTKPDVFTMLAEWYLEPSEQSGVDGSDTNGEYEDREDFYLPGGQVESRDSVLVPVWRDIIGESAIIPFDIKMRNTSLAEAIRKLDPYIAFHRTISRKSTR